MENAGHMSTLMRMIPQCMRVTDVAALNNDLLIQKSHALPLCERCSGAARVPGSAFCVECCYFYQRCINDGDVILPCACCGKHFMVMENHPSIFCEDCRGIFPFNATHGSRNYPCTRKFPPSAIEKAGLKAVTIRMWYSDTNHGEDIPAIEWDNPNSNPPGERLLSSVQYGGFYAVYLDGTVALVDMATGTRHPLMTLRAELLPDQQKLYE